jgi:hypothetical protein
MSRGMGAVVAPVFLRTARTPSLPAIHSGRGTIPFARYSCGPRGRGLSLATIVSAARSSVAVCLAAHAAGRGAVLCARALANGEDAVPPSDPPREGHSPLCPLFFRTSGTRSVPWAMAWFSVPVCLAAHAAGRGAVLCARYSCGPRGRRPSRGSFREGHSLPCPDSCGPRGRRPSRGSFREGHSPLCPDSSGPRGRGPSQATIVGAARSSVAVCLRFHREGSSAG